MSAAVENVAAVHDVDGVSDSDDSDDEMSVEGIPDVPDLGRVESLSPQDVTKVIESVHGDIVGHGGTYVSLQRILRHKREWASRSAIRSCLQILINLFLDVRRVRNLRRDTITRHR
jgi:hypothetical protein